MDLDELAKGDPSSNKTKVHPEKEKVIIPDLNKPLKNNPFSHAKPKGENYHSKKLKRLAEHGELEAFRETEQIRNKAYYANLPKEIKSYRIKKSTNNRKQRLLSVSSIYTLTSCSYADKTTLYSLLS